jgi:hypothetical protein
MAQALADGKTAEVIAKEIMKDATENKLIEISAQTYQRLEKLARYQNRTTIFNRGERAWKENGEAWTLKALDIVVESRYDQLEKQMTKAEKDAANEYFQLLVSRGMPVADAFKQAFN